MSPPASIAIPSGWRRRGSLNMPSKKTSALSRDSMGSKIFSPLFYMVAGLFWQSDAEGREQTAVDHVIRSRHEARPGACEEADHLGHLFRSGYPSQGMHPAPVLDRRLDGVLPLEEVRRPSQPRRIDRTGTHGIDPYVLLGVIDGHRPRQGVDAAFARRVGHHPRLRGYGLHARHVDDRTSPTPSHLGNGMPGRQVYPLEVDVEDL